MIVKTFIHIMHMIYNTKFTLYIIFLSSKNSCSNYFKLLFKINN